MIKLLSHEDHMILCLLSKLHMSTRTSNVKRNIVKFFYPLISFEFWNRKIGLLIKKTLNPIPYQYDYELLINMNKIKIDLTSGYKIKKAQSQVEEFNNIFLHDRTFSNRNLFFTDGSKITKDGYVGSAVVCSSLNIEAKFKLPPSASIYTAEALAILKVLKTIIQENISNSVIFSDSQSVLASIMTHDPLNISSYIIFEIRKCLYELNYDVEFVWIPSHVGIEGNELADALAKEATKSGEYLNLLLPYSDFKFSVNELLKKRHFKYLENSDTNKGVFYFNNFYKTSLNPWFKNSYYSRRHITTLIRLRTNHHSLMESLYRKNMVASPMCMCGYHEETLEHFLWECSIYNNQRSWFLTQLENIQFPFPYQSINLLSNPCSKSAKILVDFITIKCNKNV